MQATEERMRIKISKDNTITIPKFANGKTVAFTVIDDDCVEMKTL